MVNRDDSNATQKGKKSEKKTAQSIQELWGNSTYVFASPRGEERETGTEKIFGEKMVKKFSELLKQSKESQIQESQRTPSSINTNTYLDTSWSNCCKSKTKAMKATRERETSNSEE